MLPRPIEEKIQPAVEAFVKDELAGRYKEHCSDTMLVGLIMWQLGNSSRRDPSRSIGELLYGGDASGVYDAVCWLFESVLEHKCRAIGNGHHVAQNFQAKMAATFDEPDH